MRSEVDAATSAGPPCFDDAHNAWVFSRYADVRTALAAPQLAVYGSPNEPGAAPTLAPGALHDDVAEWISPDMLARWRPELQGEAERIVEARSWGEPLNLVEHYAVPWSLRVARLVTGIPSEAVDDCLRLARTVFLEAAQASDGAPTAVATNAAGALAARLREGTTGAQQTAHVQAWVALTQSLPATLSSMWLALFTHHEQCAQLRAALRDPHPAHAMTRAVAELLRFAGPAHAVFRTARTDVVIGDTNLRTNDRAILMLRAANRDTTHFPAADTLDLGRAATPHLALGAGAHRCPGRSLVHMAAAIATETLLRRAPDFVLDGDATARSAWTGGFAIRAPAAVWVTPCIGVDP